MSESVPVEATGTAAKAALKWFEPEGAHWSDSDIESLAADLMEYKKSTGVLDRDAVANFMWTMGAQLDHKKCTADNEANYANTCEPCVTYLRSVADSILQALLVAAERVRAEQAEVVIEAVRGHRRVIVGAQNDILGKRPDMDALEEIAGAERLMDEVLDSVPSDLLADLKAAVWDEGARAVNREWEQTWDIITPDEDRFAAVNPYRRKES